MSEASLINVEAFSVFANLPVLVRLTAFSFLSGADLFHKIALLSKDIRTKLPSCGILD